MNVNEFSSRLLRSSTSASQHFSTPAQESSERSHKLQLDTPLDCFQTRLVDDDPSLSQRLEQELEEVRALNQTLVQQLHASEQKGAGGASNAATVETLLEAQTRHRDEHALKLQHEMGGIQIHNTKHFTKEARNKLCSRGFRHLRPARGASGACRGHRHFERR